MTRFDRSQKIAMTGIQLTALAAFLAAFGGNQLALPSFGIAGAGTVVFGYGILTGDD